MAQTRKKRQWVPGNKVTTGFRVSDELWAVLEPVLPEYKNTHRFGGGKPRTSDRKCADAIFYVLRTGCQWRALDATELCPHSTAHDRFQQWVQAAIPGRKEKAVKWGWECESFCAWLRCRPATSQESDLRSDRGTPDRAV